MSMAQNAVFDASSLAFSHDSLGYDIGGGLNVYLAHAADIHGDLQQLHTLQGVTLGLFASNQIDSWRASAGLTFRF